jgi:AcrR family transcriptional regulator
LEGGMKLTGTEDLRVLKTIEAIRTVFEQMICEMDYHEMTVKELCERAKINKKTFYRYYPTLAE